MRTIYFKVILYILFIFFLTCNSEHSNDCFKNSGKIILQQRTVSPFNEIIVKRGIELVLTQASEYEVVIEAGALLINEVEVHTISNRLELGANNLCNFVRDYRAIKIYVKAPDIKKIVCATQYPIRSEGVLSYDRLTLISENFSDPENIAIGNFEMQLNSIALKVISNNLSSFFISGALKNLDLFFSGGSGRFEGAQLIVDKVKVLHRGTNDIVVNPQLELTGKLLSTGNLISNNTPALVSVDKAYIGALIFE